MKSSTISTRHSGGSVDWLRDYQQLIVGFGASLLGGLGLVWKLLAWRQKEHEERIKEDIDDHEERIRVMERTYASKADFESLRDDLEGQIRELQTSIRDAMDRSCAHNSETRQMLQTSIRESEQHITVRLDSVIAAISGRAS